MRWCALILMVSGTAMAGEFAVLSSGFRIHADRHEIDGGTVTLFDGPGCTRLSERDVVRFEAAETVPVTPPAAQQAAAPVDVLANPRALVAEAAKYAELPEALVVSVAKAESGLRADAVSRKGALGVMQLMPGTAGDLKADPRNTRQNVYAGTLYLRELLIRYGGQVSKALAAYNAGPGAVDKYHGVPPYRETRKYVNRVISDYVKQSQAAPSGTIQQ